MKRTLELVAAYGYPLLFVASLAESTFVVGLFIPGDAIAIVGGALAARGPLLVVPTYVAVTAGVMLGSVLSFWLGRRGGIPLLERWGARGRITRARLEALETHFRTHGPKTVLVGCFIPGTKNMVPAVAGASRMGFVRFALFGALSTVLRSALVVGIGYAFGANVERALALFRETDRWLVAGALAGIVIYVTIRRIRSKKG
jgi:membrane-associated protein